MGGPPMFRPRRLSWRAAASLAILAAAPKCGLCLAGWLGLGAALGLGGPEICGASSPSLRAGAAGWVAISTLVFGGLGGLFLRTRRPKTRSEPSFTSHP